MALAAFLKLDQTVLAENDFSDSSSYRLSGTVYTDRNLATAFNLTGYTLKLRLHKEWHNSDHFNKTLTINVAGSGTWYYNVAQNDLPVPGIYLAKIELTQTGQQISSLNRVEVLIKRGPSA